MHDLPTAFRVGGGGYLRGSVAVDATNEGWRLRHSIWELTLPACQYPNSLTPFLERSVAVGALPLHDPRLAAFAQLMIAQGCLTFDGSRALYAPQDVLYIVCAQVSSWYTAYYSHPFWEELTACRLSPSQLFAWILRTYHLSRSAGVTAARGGLHSTNPEARITFMRNALEEYEHCEAYYFPRHERFGVSVEAIKAMVPLPSSTAFDDQMSVIAETDWLAHVIVAYFQEYTVTFRQKAFDLYDRLAAHYQLGQFFEPWKAHIGFDEDQSHAESFCAALASEPVQGPRLRASLSEAARTIQYLIGALDELHAIDPNQQLTEYRDPARIAGVSDAAGAGNPSDAAARLLESWIAGIDMASDLMARRIVSAFTPATLGDIAVRALARACDHDDICFFGRLLEAVSNHPAPAVAESAGNRSIHNFLRERTAQPADVGFLVLLGLTALRRLQSGPSPAWLESAAGAATAWSNAIEACSWNIDRAAQLGGRFMEFCFASGKFADSELSVDILS